MNSDTQYTGPVQVDDAKDEHLDWLADDLWIEDLERTRRGWEQDEDGRLISPLSAQLREIARLEKRAGREPLPRKYLQAGWEIDSYHKWLLDELYGHDTDAY